MFVETFFYPSRFTLSAPGNVKAVAAECGRDEKPRFMSSEIDPANCVHQLTCSIRQTRKWCCPGRLQHCLWSPSQTATAQQSVTSTKSTKLVHSLHNLQTNPGLSPVGYKSLYMVEKDTYSQSVLEARIHF